MFFSLKAKLNILSSLISSNLIYGNTTSVLIRITNIICNLIWLIFYFQNKQLGYTDPKQVLSSIHSLLLFQCVRNKYECIIWNSLPQNLQFLLWWAYFKLTHYLIKLIKRSHPGKYHFWKRVDHFGDFEYDKKWNKY